MSWPGEVARVDVRGHDRGVKIRAITASRFSIPLREPFAISRASVDATRAVLVRADLEGITGFGEAALPLGATETVEGLRATLEAAGPELVGQAVESIDEVAAAVDRAYQGPPTGRSALVCALIDALARGRGLPLHAFLGAATAAPLVTDITLPIADPARLAELAAGYWERGFRSFKIKVGADPAHDEATVRAVAAATPEARLRFDANEGFSAKQALALLGSTRDLGLTVECFEQPCKRGDHAGLAAVRRGGAPVVADESVADLRDLEALVEAGAVDGINLKLVKMGGPDRCLEIGRRAQEHGLSLMVGAMIESKLGLTVMAHVVAALGGVEWVDLDTAFLLADDPIAGGMIDDGPELTLPPGPGLALSV